MGDLAAAVVEARTARRETVAALVGLSEDVLDQSAPWRGKPFNVRFLLLRLADDDLVRTVELERALREAGHAPGEAASILRPSAELRGRLAGSLLSVDQAAFDREPEDGAWSVRRVVGHIAAIDRRYALAVEHAVRRAGAGGMGSMRPDEATLPARDGLVESAGPMAEVLGRMEQGRDELLAAFAPLPDSVMDASTNWMAWDLDVRFRLYRFAEHDREHLVQLRKTYAALGIVPTEAQRNLEDAMAVRGALEGFALGLAEGTRAAGVAAQALRDAAQQERETVRAIVGAMG